MRGLFEARLKVLAASTPTRSDPISPGPTVTAMASIFSKFVSADLNASSMTGTMHLTCSRAACSGMIPPYFSCREADEETILDRISRPSRTTAAAVSSQEDSMAKIVTDALLSEFPQFLRRTVIYEKAIL